MILPNGLWLIRRCWNHLLHINTRWSTNLCPRF